ncbi:RNA polymerase sigma factor [Thalassotalea ganghwensis]
MNKAFEQVVAENLGRIRHIVSRYSYGDEAEDLYQEILLQLWRSFSSFTGQSNQSTWIYKVALNTACTFVRCALKQKRGSQKSPDFSVSELFAPAQDTCQADILQKFMNELSEVDANVLMMYLDGLSSDETSDVLGISGNAVRSRLKRIKQEFEQQYIGE